MPRATLLPLVAMLLVGLATPARAQDKAPDGVQYAVMPFGNSVNMPEDMPKLLDELLLTALSKRASQGQTFLGSSDITALLGLEQQKQVIGCDDESCMAEIGNALGVDFLVVPAVGRLGSKYAINYKLIDPKQVRVVKRDTLVVDGDESALPDAMAMLADAVLDLQSGIEPVRPTAANAAGSTPTGTGEAGSDGGEGMGGLGWAGVATAGLGVALLAGGGAGVGMAELTLGDPSSGGGAKQTATTSYLAGLGGIGLGLVLAGVGAVLILVGG